MARDKGFGGRFLAELMESDDVGVDLGGSFSYPSSYPAQNHNLFFLGNNQSEAERGFLESGTITQKSGSSGSDSSSTSSSSSSSFSKSMKEDSGEAKTEEKRRQGPGRASGSNATVADSMKASKKPKAEATSSTGPLKIRKEKLGERITALQQLVSPYGKTDTASVLHEAMGYIRFLHDQVQVLSSPYLQGLPSSVHMAERGNDESRYDLRSRGLCLVPVACTVHVANSNGADFWSPSMGNSSWASR